MAEIELVQKIHESEIEEREPFDSEVSSDDETSPFESPRGVRLYGGVAFENDLSQGAGKEQFGFDIHSDDSFSCDSTEYQQFDFLIETEVLTGRGLEDSPETSG